MQSGRRSVRVADVDASLTYCVVAYHFPPDTEAGAVRAQGLARVLADLGHQVHVFTPASGSSASEGYHVHVVPGRQAGEGLKSALRLAPGASLYSGLRGSAWRVARKTVISAREWFVFPDGARAWSKACATAVASWLTANTCDVLISTAPPWSVHMAAHAALKSTSGTRPIWIQDWRDLLVASPLYRFGRIRRWRDRRLERMLITEADAVTVTTQDMGRIMAEEYPRAQVTPVYNGYDERTLEQPRHRSRTHARLTFTHAGSLYEGERSALPLLASMKRLISEGAVDRSRVFVQFAGPPDATLRGIVEELGLADIVSLPGLVPRSAVPKMLEESDVVLVIMRNPAREASLIPAKTFEYMAAQRPILALNCAPSSELGRLLMRTRAGICVDDQETTDRAVLALYRRFELEGPLVSDADRNALAEFTHVRMAREFDAVARSLLAGRVNHA